MRAAFLADGMRTFASGLERQVALDIWPIFNRGQLERAAPAVSEFGQQLASTLDAFDDAPALADAVRGVRELAQRIESGVPVESRRALGTLATDLQHAADELDYAAGVDSDAVESLLQQLRGHLVGGADISVEDARAARELLGSGPVGERTAHQLGLPEPRHVDELRVTLDASAAQLASDADRERLGIMALVIAGDAASADRLRAVALDVIDLPVRDVDIAGWRRLGNLLELDAARGALDAPPPAGGSARPLAQIAARGAAEFGTFRPGRVTRRYFDAWRSTLRAHHDVQGAPLQPAGIDPSRFRVLRTTGTHSALRAVVDVDALQSGDVQRIRTAMPKVRAVFETAREEPGVTKHQSQVIASALELVERNERRLTGELVDSYRGHPDYADLGRLVAMLDLVEAIAPRIEHAALDETVDAARAGQELAW